MTITELREALKNTPSYYHKDKEIIIFRPTGFQPFIEIEKALFEQFITDLEKRAMIIWSGLDSVTASEKILTMLLVEHAKLYL
jgi:hypothetical protein